MAIIGFILCFAVALYFIIAGFATMFFGYAVSNKVLTEGTIFIIIGLVIGYFAWTDAPFHIVFN